MMTELRIREIGEAEGLAMDDLPGHRAAARRRTEDEALGRDKTTASERRAKAKAAAADDHEGHDHASGDLDEDELAEEIADDDGMALPDAGDAVRDSAMLEAMVEESEAADELAAEALEAEEAAAEEADADDDDADADAEEKS
jgi:hypothetical protein